MVQEVTGFLMWFTFLQWRLCLGNWLSGAGWFSQYITRQYIAAIIQWRRNDARRCSILRTGGPEIPFPGTIVSVPTTTRIWLVLLDFLADGPSGVPEEEKWSGCVTVGRNVNEIGWKERGWDLKWEMIRSVRKIVDFSNCEWNWQLNGRGRWVWIKK